MIYHPIVGHVYQLRYAAKWRSQNDLHERHCRVECVANGRKTVNVLVRLREGHLVVVPRGNLFEVTK